MNGLDPIRRSHLNVENYVARGYGRNDTQDFLSAVKESIDSENVVIDIKFPTADKLMAILDKEVFEHLQSTKTGKFEVDDLAAKRQKVVDKITTQWTDIITTYNAKDTTSVPILEAYQKNRGVYAPDINLNQLGNVRWVGFSLAALVIILSIGFITWVIKYRKLRVVNAAQPIFLIMICVGTIIMASSLIPFGIDDQIASARGCDIACMAGPWLFILGFTFTFSALFSKIWRINWILREASKLRRVKVKETDVLMPLVCLLLWNMVCLLTLNITDPLRWKREATIGSSGLSTFGVCKNESNPVSIAMVVLLVLGIFIPLILANIQAYKGRKLSTEFSESRYVAFCMVSILQVALVGIPLLFLVYENPRPKYFMRSAIVSIVCLSVLLLIFVPKLKAWWLPQSSARASNLGLKYTINGSMRGSMRASRNTDDLKNKIKELATVLEEKGIDYKDIFEQSGLSTVLEKNGEY